MITLFGVFLNLVFGLTVGTQSQNNPIPFSIKVNGVVESNSLVLSENWHWIHSAADSTVNCFPDTNWNPAICSDPNTCWKLCAIEGIPQSQWTMPYGASVSNGNSLRLNYVTVGQYGTNVGSRWYLLDNSGNNYRSFNLVNRRFSFTTDVSNLPCGLNGALYFVEMPMNGGPNLVSGYPAQYGLSYCDAQCSNIKFINGFANTNNSGSCCAEMDIWEANSYATQFTSHNTKYPGQQVCTNSAECGQGNGNRYSGFADMDGADVNLYRNGNLSFYGHGNAYTVNTMLPFTVHTDFITSDATDSGDLIKIVRYYEQNGKFVFGGSQTDASIAAQKLKYGEFNHFGKLGGLKAMGNSLKRGHVIVLSLWDDTSVNMRWLDAVDPVGSSAPGALRGPCSPDSGLASELRSQSPNSYVVYSDIQLNRLSTPAPAPKPTPTPTPAPAPKPTPTPNSSNWNCQQCVWMPTSTPSPAPVPTPSPSSCSAVWQQCGGKGWGGATCCQSGSTCKVTNEWYSQCIPS